MEILALDNTASFKELKLNSVNSYLNILRAELIQDEQSKLSWHQIITMLQIRVELKYIVYVDPDGRFIDDRTKEYSIEFNLDIYQIQPIFEINKCIKNEELTVGWNPYKKHYTSLKIEVIEKNKINEAYALNFLVEKFDMD